MSEKMCCVVRDLLPLHMEGMLEEPSRAFIDQHLAECAGCRQARQALIASQREDIKEQEVLIGRLRRANLRRKMMIWLCIAALILAAAVCVLPMRRPVDRQVQAFRWQAGHGEAGSQQVSVTLKGVYLDYLFRTDRYEGDLMIGGVDITQREGAFAGCVLDDAGLLYYANEEALLESVGFIVAMPGMEEFVIGLYEKNDSGVGEWNSRNGMVVTSSADTREQAVNLTRQILRLAQNRLAGVLWEAGIQP